MKEPAADELMWMKCDDGGLAGLAGGPFEEDVAVGVVSDEAFGAEGAALDVAGKVADGGASAAGMLELYVPWFRRAEDVMLAGC